MPETIYYAHVHSPIGPFLLAGDGCSLTVASFSRGQQQRQPEPTWRHDPSAVNTAITQIEEYFAGTRTVFDLRLDLRGTEFQKAVWRVLLAIPFGTTWSYGQIAHELGRPGASRAVGAANRANTIPLIIPCHRVIGSDGGLTGFGGGLDTKRWLLEFEGALPGQQVPLF